MGKFSIGVLSAVSLAVACCAVVAGTVRPAGASESAAGPWGTAQPVPGLAALSTGSVQGEGTSTSGINSLSCGAAGNCAAGGWYEDSADDEEAFVVDESGWSWGTALEVPGLAALSTGVVYPGSDYAMKSVLNSLSCGAAGDCAAGGAYVDSAGDEQAFVVDESGGSWGTAEEVPGLAALNTGGVASVDSVSCTSAGNCAAVGSYVSAGSAQAFVVDETGGSWGTAEEVPGAANLMYSVSCASAGNCAAGGEGGAGPFVVAETGGTWGTQKVVPSSDGLVTSVSCASAGNCAAVGWYASSSGSGLGQAFVMDETGGTWGTAEVLAPTSLGLGPSSDFDSVSCGSAGNCVAVGDSAPNPYLQGPIMAVESGGSWGKAQRIPEMTDSVPSVSCASAGNCAVSGLYSSSGSPVMLDETGGSWGTAQQIPGPADTDFSGDASAVSCASAGNCAAGGTYGASGVSQAFVVSEKPATSSVLALSAAKATYGKEQAERVSVMVSAETGATPSGTVTVNAGTAVVCGNVTLSAGQASCTVAATKLPAGTWHLTASYSGSADLAPSTSAAGTLTVAKAASKVTLALSAARVTYGHEGSERLTVKVTGQYAGTPGGKVTVKSGKVTVCTITLAAGKGTCILTARKLPVGTRTLIAVYSGSGDFTGAASASKTLKVVT